MEKKKHIHFGKKMKQIRLEKGISQEDLAERLSVGSNSYISDAERGRFLPSDDKLKAWADIMGLTWEEVEDLKQDAELERLGLTDPGFTMMFKEVPNMNAEEKASLIRAYEAVMKAREAQRKKK
ncbi:MAG: helix-turn-helix transcriptional regulator [Thermoleophilia bacterium]|nr:helix-turn-helix transcriptional regulator [Thermoleophilia bacterium]